MDITDYKKTITQLTQDLTELELYAKNLEMENSRTTLNELNEHIKSDRFNLAVLGEFRRGKSTLINALLRTPILPSDLVPTTASVNRITYDAQAHAKVEYFDGNAHEIPINELVDYATQDGDKSENVREVTVWYPTVYCANNVDIYDTPGLNDSTDMTKATMDVISRMDIAIFTLAATTNFSLSECEFIGEKLLTSNVGRILFVVTRMGEYTEEEQARIIQSIRKRIEKMVLGKAEEVLSDNPEELENFKNKLGDIPIFGVDSVMALKARQEKDAVLLERSGFPAFERAIDEMLTQKRGLVMLEKQTSAIMKAANDIFNVIQTCMGPLTMDEAEFAEKCKKADEQIKAIQGTLEKELKRLDDAAKDIKEQTRNEWEGYVQEIKEQIQQIASTLEISMSDLTPKGRKRMCEDVWETKMSPAIMHSMQVYSEKIQNSVSATVGKECQKLDSYAQDASEKLAAFTQLFAPKNSRSNNARGQILSFIAFGLAGKYGYTAAGTKGAIVGGLSGAAVDITASAALTALATTLGLAASWPVALGITAVAAAASVFTGKKLTERLFWRNNADQFRKDMADMACQKLDELLAEIDFARQIEDYVAETFEAIKKELNTSMNGSLQDMQKALAETRVNFAGEKAEMEQKVQNYTAILQSLSVMTERTMVIRREYGLEAPLEENKD